MKTSLVLLLALLGVCVIGCSTQTSSRGTLSRSLALQISAYDAALKKGGGGSNASPEIVAFAVLQSSILVRSNALVELQSAYDTELKKFSERLLKLTGQAQLFGVGKVAINWLGLGAGVAGAALSAASPANTVWVTAFSAFSGAANGFAAAGDTEGFSKTVVANFIGPVVTDVANAVQGFSLAEAQEHLFDTNSEAFWKAMKTNSVLVGQIRVANIKIMQPPLASFQGQLPRADASKIE